jgi:uncharacterized delta-60 repeat protein
MNFSKLSVLTMGGFISCGMSQAVLADSVGKLDTGFGQSGMIMSPIVSRVKAMSVQNDGKIIIMGPVVTMIAQQDGGTTFYQDDSSTEPTITIVRYQNDGNLDMTFGDGGTVLNGEIEQDNIVISNSWPVDSALQKDGKIVIARTDNSYNHCMVVRYNSDGRLDPSFGKDGKVITGDESHCQNSTKVILDDEGKIILIGKNGRESNGIVVMRYHSHGAIDTTFGMNGQIIANLDSMGEHGDAVLSDGKIVLIGSDEQDQILAMRYNSNGDLDTSFADGGKLILSSVYRGATTLAALSNGKIIVATNQLARYNRDGSLDTTFVDHDQVIERALPSHPNHELFTRKIVSQQDDKIIVAGDTYTPDDPNKIVVVARYNQDGHLDPTFGDNGRTSTSTGNTASIFDLEVALGPDNQIILAGSSVDYQTVEPYTFLVRYHGDGTHATSGQSALVERDLTSGIITMRYFEGSHFIDAIPLTTTLADQDWQITYTSDFNSDGETDLIWRHQTTGQNAVWYLNKTTLVDSAFLTTVPDLHWQIVGMGDFNRDNQSDLVWRNRRTGEDAIWFMNGTKLVNSIFLPKVPETQWQIAGVGDFNNDRYSDLIWRNQEDGRNVVWYLNGGTLVNSAFLATVPDSSWQIIHVNDFNSDYQPDLLWQNRNTGLFAVWYMQEVTIANSIFIPAI